MMAQQNEGFVKARAFNKAGMAQFDQWLDEVDQRGRHAAVLPLDMLYDDDVTEIVGFEVPVQRFSLKYDLGKCLCDAMGPKVNAHLKNAGLWSWLALALHESTMPKRKEGFFVGHRSRHRIQKLEHRPNQSQLHRHLVYGAAFNVHRFGENARVLMQRPDQQARIEEDIMSRRTSGKRKVALAGAEGCVALLNRLYGAPPPKRGKPKPEERSRGLGKGRGEFLRFVRWLTQIGLTYDVVSLSGAQLEAILPGEFAERLGA